MHAVFWLENLMGRDHSEDLDIDGRIMLHGILGKGVDWIHLAQNRDQWWDLVNTIMNPGFHKR